MKTFNDFSFSSELRNSIEKLGFEKPTQIQEKTIPLVLEGKDVLGESATGSGKTLAFGCGIVEKVVPQKGLQALVLTPTRELAEQVKNTICEMAGSKKLKIISVYGGISINPQIDDLRRAEVVISTPGRFKDHLQRRTVNTSNITILVLDEADRMLDMGFIEDIEFIINKCPKNRQTLFFSATIPPQIEKLSKRYLKSPIKISAEKMVDPEKLEQIYYDVQRNLKFSLLLHLINKETSKLVMVFCNTRHSTDMIVKSLRANDVDAIAIHGGFTQNKRNHAIENFKNGKVGVLVCTDVVSRGIHIDNISHIYNYEIPKNPVDYVHRIGRTARAGEDGIVVNLISEYDHDSFSSIIREYRSFNIKKIQTPYVERKMTKQEDRSRSSYGNRNNSARGRFSHGRR